MGLIKKTLLFLRKWLIPTGWDKLIKNIILHLFSSFITQRKRLKAEKEEEQGRLSVSEYRYNYSQNAEFHRIHDGEDLFILCTGPSINETNLSLLKNKVCMSVSNFYKHPLYSELRPRYHVTPSIMLESFRIANPDPEQAIITWFSEMHVETKDATLFFGSRQIDLITKEGLFADRKVRFLHTGGRELWPNMNNLDITRTLCPIQSVPILCLIVGLYMGFKRMYLLGVDHDEMKRDKYEYFFHRDQLRFRDVSVKDDGTPVNKRYEQFRTHMFLWEQYMAIAEIANHRGVEIINLNPSSFLDVFPKMPLDNAK